MEDPRPWDSSRSRILDQRLSQADTAVGQAGAQAPLGYDPRAAWIVGAALFLQSLDGTIVSTALPAMAASLDQPVLRLNITITAYLLSCAVFIPASGWIADRFGAKRAFMASVALFTVASILCGLSQTLAQLVVWRVAQGAAAALIIPVGRLILVQRTPRADLVRAMSTLGVPVVLGPVVGPPLGGLIVSQVSWPWIFFINLPIGLVALGLAWAFLSGDRGGPVKPLDLRGLMLSGLGAALVVYAVADPAQSAAGRTVRLAMIAAGAASLVAYCLHARRAAHPALDLSLLRIDTFRSSLVGGAALRLAFGGVPFLLALMLQLGFGLDPFTSGLVAFTSAVASLLMKTTARHILRRFGFRPTLVVNSLLVSATLGLCGLIDTHWSMAAIVALLLVGGFFRSLQYTGVNSLIFADVDSPRTSQASSFAGMMQQLSESIGVGLAALAVTTMMQVRGSSSVSIGDVAPCFAFVAALHLLATPFYLNLRPSAGHEVSGRA